jgi:hypothetical protein
MYHKTNDMSLVRKLPDCWYSLGLEYVTPRARKNSKVFVSYSFRRRELGASRSEISASGCREIVCGELDNWTVWIKRKHDDKTGKNDEKRRYCYRLFPA